MSQDGGPNGQENLDRLSRIVKLTTTEANVLGHLLSGKTEEEAAAALGMNEHNVSHYRKRLYAKLRVHRRVQLPRRVEQLLRDGRDGANFPGCSPL